MDLFKRRAAHVSIFPAVYLVPFLTSVGTDLRKYAIAALIAEGAVSKDQSVFEGFHQFSKVRI